MKRKLHSLLVLASTSLVLVVTSSRLPADTGICGGVSTTLPFTDVAGNAFFCQIAEAFFSGLTNGTTATTYSPSSNVPRNQMAAFITRVQQSALQRGARRAALEQWATPTDLPMTARTAVGAVPLEVKSDGMDLWVTDFFDNDVKRVRASDGRVLETWTGASSPFGVLVARGRIYVGGGMTPGSLYTIDPSKPPGPVTTLSSSLGDSPRGIATDGTYIWTANAGGSISKVNPDTGVTTNIVAGFSVPLGILFDGANLWVTDGTLKRLDSSGNILQNVPVGSPGFPAFDGSNIWVPNFNSNSVTVVRARDGLVLAELTGNGLSLPRQAGFDGQRIMVTNFGGSGSLSIWKATDLTPAGSVPIGDIPNGVCSDGVNFWITLTSSHQLARF